jgi:hypothetical protein
LSNELKKIVKEIQFRTDKTIEEIANEIGYARAYFTNQVSIGTNKNLKRLLQEKYKLDNEQSVRNREPGYMQVNEEPVEYNTLLTTGNLKVTLGDYVSLLKEMAIKAEEREREYLSIIKNKLISIDASSKEMAEDISALTIEVQAEHRAMMDTLDKAAGYKIGTTRGAAHTVELASQQERAGKGKQTKADKQD